MTAFAFASKNLHNFQRDDGTKKFHQPPLQTLDGIDVRVHSRAAGDFANQTAARSFLPLERHGRPHLHFSRRFGIKKAASGRVIYLQLPP